MFKSLRSREKVKVKDKVDFKFGFRATKVPLSGWDKLVVSVVPLDTGKVSKTTRAVVRNGSCQWADSIIETTKLSQDVKTQEYDEKLYKFIVSTGSSRSGILGEITIDVAEYTSARSPAQVASQLKSCNSGTILHTTITCLTPRTRSSRDLDKSRAKERNEISLEDDEISGTEEEELDDSDQSTSFTNGSFSSNTSAPAVPAAAAFNSAAATKPTPSNGSQFRSNKDAGIGPPKQADDGLDSSLPRVGGQNAKARALASDKSPATSFNSGTGARQDAGSDRQDREQDREKSSQRAASSQDSSNILGASQTRSSTATSNGPSAGQTQKSGLPTSHGRSNDRADWTSQRSHTAPDNGSKSGSNASPEGKDALQADLVAAEATIQELRLETVATRREKRTLVIEIETLKQELKAHVRHGAENELEMTTLTAERDRLRQDLEHVRSSMVALKEKESGEGNARWEVEDAQRALVELEEETRHQKEQNNNLNLQLHKTQDANMELMLGFRDLEEALDQKKKEVEELSILNNELEEQLDSKHHDSFAQMEREWNARVKDLEDQKKLLQAKVVSLEGAQVSAKADDEHIQKLERMIEQLTRDVEELEKESKELTDENVDLYANAEGMKRDIQSKSARIAQLEEQAKKEPPLSSRSVPSDAREISDLRNLVKELEAKLSDSEDAQNEHLTRNKGHVEELQSLLEELGTANSYLERQLKNTREEARVATAQVESARSELGRFEQERNDLEKEKVDLEYRLAEERETLERSLGEAREAFAAQEQELRTIEESATRAEEDHSIAVDKIAGLEDDIARLKAETRSIIEAKSSGESLSSLLQTQKADQEALRKSAEAETEKLREQVRQREAEIALLLQQITAHTAQREEIESMVAQLDRQTVSLESSLQDSLEGDRLSKSRIQELEFQLSVMSEEMESVNFSKHEFEVQLSHVEDEKKVLEAKEKDVISKLQSAEAECKLHMDHAGRLEAEFAGLQAQMDTQTSSRRNLERRASDLESTKDDLYNQLTDAEEENLKHTERISALEAQLRSVVEERETHKMERDILEARSMAHNTDKSKVEAALVAAVKEHQQKVSDAEAKMDELTAKNDAHVNSQKELQKRIQMLEHEATSNLDSAKVMKDKSRSLESIKARLESDLQQVTEKYSVASSALASLDAEMSAIKADGEEKASRLLLELATMKQSNSEMQQRAKHVEDSHKRSYAEKSAAVERLQVEVQRLTEQMTATNDEKEVLASEALVEASELRAEKGEWEERLRQSEEKFEQANSNFSLQKVEYVSKLQDSINRIESLRSAEQETASKLNSALRELGDLKEREAASRNLAADVEAKLAAALDERKSLEEEVDELKIKVQDTEMLGFEIQRLQGALRQMKNERDSSQDSARNIKVLNEYLEQEKTRLEEDISAWEKENEELKLEKAAIEEKVLRLQEDLETHGAIRSADAEQRGEAIKLRRENTECKRKATELEEEKEELRRRVKLLEEGRENGRTFSNGANPSPGRLQRSLSSSNSKTSSPNRPPSLEAKEFSELRAKVRSLEFDVESKSGAIDALKRDFHAKESILYKKIELLEEVKDQLLQGGPDSGIDQLQMELTRLQNLNAGLARRERELVSQLSTQDVLHKEVQRLQEENEQLENRFLRFKETAKYGNIMEKVVALETELSEAMEANSMYKMQLRNAFAKPQNVQAAALRDYGDVDQMMGDLVRLKKAASKSEDDVKDLRERYTTMSLKYAEASSRNEELIMALRNLRNGKRS